MEESTWLTHTLVYLSAAVVVVPLSRALGLGAIIGYLAAGIAIGPWGLRLVSDVQTILHFAEFGVVLMLFLVGLELEPKRLWALRRPIFGWGSAQVLGCAAALTLVGMLAGAGWKLALVAGLGLALSSTAIALQVLGERNQLATNGGQAGFSILLFQDVAAIPILALLPLLGGVLESNDPEVGASSWFEAIKIVAVIGSIVLGGRLLLRPVFRWIARSGMTEIFTAASLLLVVATAALMQFVGLSMALGAFLAGVLLAESEYRRELETDIEPFKGLLLGLFFIAVGMSIDFGVLWKQPGLIALVVLGFMAVKAAVIYGLSRAMGVPYQERPVLTLLLAQGGEFAFVVFQAAAGAHVFPAQTASLLIGAVAISMLLSPLVLVLIDKFILPRFANCGVPQMEEIKEEQHAPIIVAGAGRYGQIVLRVLYANGYTATVLDHDPEQIEAIGRFGYRVFYGDATRMDLLRVAGAAEAKLLIVAVDGIEQSLKIVDICRESFPNVTLVVRARNVRHYYELRNRGVEHIERETFDAALMSAKSALELMGMHAHQAISMIRRFRAHNVEQLEQMWPHHKDEERLISMAKAGRQQLEELMAQERAMTLLPAPEDQNPAESSSNGAEQLSKR